MIKFGADRIFKAAEGEAPSDEDLETILDRSNAVGQAGVLSCGLPAVCSLLRSNPEVHTDIN